MIKYVRSDYMASVLLNSKLMEPRPEPFRLQPDLIVYIQEDEYFKFLEYTKFSCIYLSTPVTESQKIETGTAQFYKAFYTDVAFAVLKELHFAEPKNCGATKIVHKMRKSSYVIESRQELELTFQRVKSHSVPRLKQLGELSGYTMPINISIQNIGLWYYANILIAFGESGICFEIKEEIL